MKTEGVKTQEKIVGQTGWKFSLVPLSSVLPCCSVEGMRSELEA